MTEPFLALYTQRESHLRLRWVALACITAALWLARLFVNFPIEQLGGVIALVLIEIAAVQLIQRRLFADRNQPLALVLLRLLMQLQVIAELVLLTLAVHFTGGISSPLLGLFLIYLFADGAISSIRVLIAHAALAAVLLLSVALGEYNGWLRHYSIWVAPDAELYANPAYVVPALCAFAALLIITLCAAIATSRDTVRRAHELNKSTAQLALRVEQMNVLSDIGRRLSSTLELNQVLDSVCDSALRLVKATDAHVFPYDEVENRFLSGAGVRSDGRRGTAVTLPRADGLSARVVHTKKPILIPDAEHHPLFQSPEARAWSLQSIAGFPLMRSHHVVGVMNVAFTERHLLTQEQEQALLVLADQAAIAIDNARVYQQLERKIQELTALFSITQSATQLGDLTTLLNDALHEILNSVRANGALVAHVKGDARKLELAAYRGPNEGASGEVIARDQLLGDGIAEFVIQTGKPLSISNVERDPRGNAFEVEYGFNSLYAVPLRAFDKVTGVLELFWRDEHSLAPGEVSLLGAIAPQLAVAMHNARLYQETIRRADELATLRAIGLATTSTLNLREQLRLLYENVNQLLKADTFFAATYDQVSNELRIEYVVEEGWFLRPLSVPLDKAGLSAWVIKNQKPLRANDLAKSSELPATPQHVTRPARSWLGVPLLLQNNIMGLISAQSFAPNAFTVEDERFLIAVAQHLTLALENARLFGETERRTRELTLINEISRAISASLELDVIIDRTVNALSDQLGYRYVAILELDHAMLNVKAQSGYSNIASSFPTTTGIVGRVARTARPAFVTSPTTDPDYLPVAENVAAEICVPIAREGRVYGVLNVEDSRVGELKDDDLRILTVLADQLAIAATNARLYRDALNREHFANRLGQLSMTLASTLDLVHTIETVSRESLALFGVDTAAIFIRQELSASDGALGAHMNPSDSRLVCRAAAGANRERLIGFTVNEADAEDLLVRILRHTRPWLIHDVPSSRQVSRELAAVLGAQALLAVPILKEHDAIGVLILGDCSNPVRFDDSDLARAAIVAAQAGLSLSNARLLNESQRRAREQSSLYDIGLAVSSTLNLDEQLELIYQHISRHFTLNSFYIALREGDNLSFALYVDQSAHHPPFIHPIKEAGLTGWVLEHRQPLVIDDIKRQWDHLPVKPKQRGEPIETSTYIGLPLLIKAQAIGVMALERVPVEPFSVDEQRFLFALAQQVSFAVDNARLHRESQRGAAQQSLLYQASRRIAVALDLETLVKGIVDALSEDFGYKAVLVMLVDRDTQELRPAAASTDIARLVTPGYRQKVGDGLMGTAAQTGQTQVANDTSRNPQFFALEEWCPAAEVAVPIKSGARVLGVLNVESLRVNAFSDADVRMFEAIADQLAVAMENARLYQQTRAQLEQLKETQGRLIDTERRAAIGELVAGLAHEINNPLTAIMGHAELLLEAGSSNVASVSTMQSELETISIAAQRIARIVQEFMKLSQVESGHVQRLDLREIVSHTVRRFEGQESAQDVAMNLITGSEPLLVRVNPMLIDQVVSNILTNSLEAMPHGGMIEARIDVWDNDSVFCAIRDSGYGIPYSDLKRVFEPSYTTKVESGVVRGIGLGLYTAEQIIRSYGGTIAIESEEGHHTTVTFTLPVAQRDNENAN